MSSFQFDRSGCCSNSLLAPYITAKTERTLILTLVCMVCRASWYKMFTQLQGSQVGSFWNWTKHLHRINICREESRKYQYIAQSSGSQAFVSARLCKLGMELRVQYKLVQMRGETQYLSVMQMRGETQYNNYSWWVNIYWLASPDRSYGCCDYSILINMSDSGSD